MIPKTIEIDLKLGDKTVRAILRWEDVAEGQDPRKLAAAIHSSLAKIFEEDIGWRLTDLARFQGFLREACATYELRKDVRIDPDRVQYMDLKEGQEDIAVDIIRMTDAHTKHVGYLDFFTEVYFDKAGNLIAFGSWE